MRKLQGFAFRLNKKLLLLAAPRKNIPMDRLEIIQTLMRKKKLNNYLEIGVFNGHIFFRIKSDFKIAVDPEFRFDGLRKAGKLFLNPYNIYNRYYSKTSDAFFEQDAPGLFARKKLDISLIDGMHEYAFALRDIENALHYLSGDGVIIVHDCNALTAESACSFEEWKARGFTGTWNGDVWKAILHIRSLRKDCTAFVLDTDHGLGIITKKPDHNPLDLTRDQIDQLTFTDFNMNRKEWIGLKPQEYFNDFFRI